MKRILIAAALLLAAIAHAQNTATAGWQLTGPDGAAIGAPHRTQTECDTAARARTIGAVTVYTCPRQLRVTPPAAPTCTAPQPAAETRTQACPAGTTGSWLQTRSYTAAPAPACWGAGAWTPAEPPAGACVTPPPVEPPPVEPPPVVGSWVAAANEGGSFTVSAPTQGRFGTGSTWRQREVSGTVLCSAATFGGDPAPGIGKRCEIAVGGVPPVEPPPVEPPPVDPGPVTPPPAGATVLHFSDCQAGAAPTCIAGSNGNSGAPDAPRRDLTGVNLNALAAGTTLRFARGGAWAVGRISLENLNVSAAAPLTLEAYGTGPRPVFRSTGNGVGWQLGGGHGNTTDDRGYVLRGLELRGTGSTAGDHWGIWLTFNVSDVLLDDVAITNFGLGIHAQAGSPHGVNRITVRGGEISRNLSMGFLGTLSDSVFEGTLYEANNFSGSPMSHAIYASGGNRNVIRGNRFLNNSVVNGQCVGGNYTVHGVIDGLLIENNTIEVPAAGWSCGGFNVTAGYDYAESFRNVVVRGNTGVNLGQCLVCINSAPGAVIEGNRAFTRAANAPPLTLANGFMSSETPMTGVIVRDNTICGAGTVTNISGATVEGSRTLPATDPACAR